MAAARVGNIYVNRSMIGAVVGVQPFGGEGLSGTGPKAGGPHYLLRFATERTLTVNTAAVGGVTELLARPRERKRPSSRARSRREARIAPSAGTCAPASRPRGVPDCLARSP